MKSDRIDEDAVMTETVVHDRVWGESTEGPVYGEQAPEEGGLWVRDVRRDPWGGPAVQDVDELPGEYAEKPVVGGVESPVDDETGGNAGIVGLDERLYDRGM
jgi:hypothetical protein